MGKLEIMAYATKQKAILEAEAAAEAIPMKGEAEAFAIECKGKAEAEQMAKKADAWKEYKEAAKVAIWLDTMPAMAAEVAAPLSQCEKITMICTGEEGEGPARVTKEVMNIMESIPTAVQGITGVPLKLR